MHWLEPFFLQTSSIVTLFESAFRKFRRYIFRLNLLIIHRLVFESLFSREEDHSSIFLETIIFWIVLSRSW